MLRWATVPEQSGPKSGGLLSVPLSVAGTGSPSNTMSHGARPIFVVRTKWYPDTYNRLATTHIGRKVGLAMPLSVRLCPHLTQYRLDRSRPTSVQSGILVHPAVWPQYGPKSAGGAAVPLSETELPPGEGSSVPI